MVSTAVYRSLMLACEARRLELGHSMATVNDMAGLQDGYYPKMIYPDTPSGRQAQWATVDLAFEALFGKGYTITIQPGEMRMLSAPSIDKGASINALKNRHWRHTKHFRDLGKKGGQARLAKLSPKQHSALAKRMARKRWSKARSAKRQGAAHAAANAASAVQSEVIT